METGESLSLCNAPAGLAAAGYVVQWFGHATGFPYLATIAVCALAFFALLMPETKDARLTAVPARHQAVA